uniref:Uncharacterized protein n=1 Tax=Setaria digitata TaxID=48799 RepID=A0A915PL39_9BILA
MEKKGVKKSAGLKNINDNVDETQFSGFGRDLVKRCLLNGLTSVKELEESYGSISQGRLYAFQMDVADDESVRKSRKLVDSVLREKGLVLHALINNAGVRGNLFYDEFLILDDYKEVWDVNMLGVIRVTHTFRDLIKKSRGRIVTCSSGIVSFPAPGNAPYATSKYAIQAYSIVIRHELQPYGVDVIDIVPGDFSTEMQSIERLIKMVDKVWYRASQKKRDEFGKDYHEKAKKFAKNMVQWFVEKDTTWVIDAYYEAIVAKRPRLLHRVGWDLLLVFLPYSFLSLRLQLHIMKLLMLAIGAPLPAMAKRNSYSDSRECKSD